MGELIRREAAATPLTFTGERLTAAISGQIEIEHYHRYLLAREFCRGRDVLDVASGEGYGTALLAQIARSAVGIEIDADTVTAARAEFQRPNLRYEQGDARSLPLPDDSIDVVVSFETLEHLAEHDVFLSELRRVLRPDGLLIISTPDRDAYSPPGAAPNPYHVLELTRAEFEALLVRHFVNSVFATQRALIGSVILRTGPDVPVRSYEKRGDMLIESSEHFSRAPFVVAFASDVALPPLPNSVYVYRTDLDTDLRVRLEAEAGRRAAEQAASEGVARATAAESRAVDAERQTGAAGQRVAEAEAKVERAERQAAEAEAKVERAERQAAEAEAKVERTERQAAEAEAKVERAERQAAEAEARVERAERQAAEAAAKVERAERQAAAAEAKVERAERQAAEAEAKVERAERQAAEAEARVERAERQAAEAAAKVERAERRTSEAEGRLSAIETSTTWRSTRPLRAACKRFPLLALSLRRGIKLAWWAVTLQLPRRYRSWRESRQLVIAESKQEFPSEQSSASQDREIASRLMSISLPSSNTPLVSIIISTYGQLNVTAACLQSIAANAPNCPVEVLVVDDAYPGAEDMSALLGVPGIKFFRNPTNLGFLLSCNQAARRAKGRYIYMLNNDTEIQPGAIDALVEVLESRPDVAMVGSKLVYPDGSLQEAGGILWSDASGWNYGRGQDPSRPDFNYTREVDYCSAASIMIRANVFESLGGFDEAFAPAYCEDSDLAFRIRKNGMKVLYEPRSVVIHHEGVSHGTDLTAGVKAHQLVNQALMVKRWGDTLSKEHYANAEHVMRARDRARDRKVILVIEHYVPEPDRDAGSRANTNMLNVMVDAGWSVKFWPHNRAYSDVYTTLLERQGIEVLDSRWPGHLGQWLAENGADLDYVLVNRPDIAADVLAYLLRGTPALLAYYGHDLHYARMRRQSEVEGNKSMRRDAHSMQRLEERLWKEFDVVLYPSEEEAAVVRNTNPKVVARAITPFFFDSFPDKAAATEGFSILFVAGFQHPPNVDAAAFLIKTILPLIEHKIGSVRVTLAGSNPTDAVKALAGPNVDVTGYVTDDALGRLYDSHRVSIVPLRFGAGVKGKVVEPLCRGVPVVTTSIGAQGIPGLSDVVPVHDNVDSIVAALAVLMTDDSAWMAQSHRQMELARRMFSREATRKSVIDAFETFERSSK